MNNVESCLCVKCSEWRDVVKSICNKTLYTIQKNMQTIIGIL